MHMCECALRGQKRVLDPLELEFQAYVSQLAWVLRSKLYFSCLSSKSYELLKHLSSPKIQFLHVGYI